MKFTTTKIRLQNYITVLVVICLFAMLLSVSGRPGHCDDETRRVRVRINRVDTTLYPTNFLNVTIIGLKGKKLEELGPENFVVHEEDKEQKVLDVVQSDKKGAPIYVVLVIDRSGSMHSAINDAKTAAKLFVKKLSSDDKVSIITFSTNYNVECGFTNDTEMLKETIDGIKPFGSTALYGSTVEAVRQFKDVENVNKAVIVLTDGRNNRAGTPQDCINASLDAGVPLYTIGLGSSVDRDKLRQIANETGGEFKYAPNSSDLEEVYEALASQLKSQLWIKYQSSPHRWPKTKVKARVKLTKVRGSGDSSRLNYVVPLQWWKLILTYVIAEIVIIFACYLFFRLMWRNMNFDPVWATRLAILLLFVLTGVWYFFIFFKFVPILYFIGIGVLQLLILLIPVKMLAE